MKTVLIFFAAAFAFSSASAQACIGRVSDERKAELEAEIEASMTEHLSAQEIYFIDDIDEFLIAGSKGNCRAVTLTKIQRVVYEMTGSRLCKSTVTSTLQKGLPGQDDSIKHVSTPGNCVLLGAN